MNDQRMVDVELLLAIGASLSKVSAMIDEGPPTGAKACDESRSVLRKLAAIIDGPGVEPVAPAAWVKYEVGRPPHFVPVINGHVTFACPASEALEYEPLYLAAQSAPVQAAQEVVEKLEACDKTLRELRGKYPVQAVPDEVCTWKPMDDEFMPGTYEGSCGAAWSFIEGGVAENDMKYCPQCGRKVVIEHAPQRPLSEDGGESTAQSSAVACPAQRR